LLVEILDCSRELAKGNEKCKRSCRFVFEQLLFSLENKLMLDNLIASILLRLLPAVEELLHLVNNLG